ncbi:uncharacterized protein LOC144911761 isoform X2 [Branchiostoma floridae x Branchiostoma belcheri]
MVVLSEKFCALVAVAGILGWTMVDCVPLSLLGRAVCRAQCRTLCETDLPQSGNCPDDCDDVTLATGDCVVSNCSGAHQCIPVGNGTEDPSFVVTAYRSTSESVRVSWSAEDAGTNPPAHPSTVYVVFVQQGDGEWLQVNQTTSSLLTAKGLPACHRYHLQVAAVGQRGLQRLSPVVYLDSSVTDLTIGTVMFDGSRFQAAVTWQHPAWWGEAGQLTHYSISADRSPYCQDKIFPFSYERHLTNETRQVYLDVPKGGIGCIIYFKLQPYTTCGAAEGTVIVLDLTDCSQIENYTCVPETPGPVQNIRATVIPTTDGIYANLTWDRPNHGTGQISSFLVRWGQCVTVSILSWINDTTANSTIVPGNVQHYLLRELRPNRRYGVQVLALTPYYSENDVNFHIAHVTCFETGGLHVHGTTEVTLSKMRTALLESTLPYGLPVGETIPPSASTSPLPLYIYIVPACIAAILLAVSYCYYRHYKFSSLTKTVDDEAMWKKNIYIAGHHQPADSLDVVKPEPCDRWEIPFSRLTLYETLGRGAFGKVVRGVLMGSVPTHRKASSPIATEKAKSFNVTVAVKMLHELAGECQVQAFLEEIQLMKRVGYHPNVVSLLACCTTGSPICLVVEHMPQGDLLRYLRSKRSQVYAGSGDELLGGEGSLTQMNLLSFARQIAVGMEFLWQKGFVHRDLAARNVLVGDDGVVKIGDFGLTRYVYTDKIYVSKRGGKLPIKWMSPEAIFDQTFTAQSDIWSFGVVLWELSTLGACPYPGIQNRDMLALLQRGHRMEQPENCPDEMYQLMLTCWHERPEDRPSFTDIRNFLEDLMEKDTPYLDLRVDRSKDYYKAVDSSEDDSVEVVEPGTSCLVAPSAAGQSATLPSSLESAGTKPAMVPSEWSPPKGITLPRTSKESLSSQPSSHPDLTDSNSSHV